MYGGAAEYGVINIITKGASQRNGVFASGTYGQLTNTFGRRNLSVGIGQSFKDFHVDLSVFKGEGNRSGTSYTPLGIDKSYSLKDSSEVNPTNINLGLNYKNASLRIMYDDYTTTTSFFQVDFKSFMADFKYKFNLSKKINITPQITYIN
jgi:outer membrane cobalamin receptor